MRGKSYKSFFSLSIGKENVPLSCSYAPQLNRLIEKLKPMKRRDNFQISRSLPTSGIADIMIGRLGGKCNNSTCYADLQEVFPQLSKCVYPSQLIQHLVGQRNGELKTLSF
ncbi:hypothetical protein CDAR_58271 [Caerostris darwini]|uniref:LAGLIDADG homing endonuclease n=1 Tax=Caerostris darwini TaxID=1538125 RepID=A0AAV4U758_9ARAC|nr:hypothetical protein CDAR_58271 [Caerostris darwini]